MLKGKKGFSLVELMIAMVIAGILFLIVGIIQVSSTNFWIRGNDKVVLQGESSFMLTVLTKAIRESTNAQILNSGQRLELERKDKNKNLEWTKVFYQDGKDLKYKINEEEDEILISGILHSLDFNFPEQNEEGEYVPGVIGIEVVLKRKEESFSTQKTIVMRNFKS